MTSARALSTNPAPGAAYRLFTIKGVVEVGRLPGVARSRGRIKANRGVPRVEDARRMREVVRMSPITARSVEDVLTVKAALDYGRLAQEFPGAALRRFGERVVATRMPALPNVAQFSKVRGLSLADRGTLGELVAFYRETGQRLRVELWAQDDVPELRHLLRAEGLAPTTATVALSAHSDAAPQLPTGVQVDQVDGTDQRYLDVLVDGYQVPPEARDLRRMLAIEHSTPGLCRYLAAVDGRPAAAAALFPHSGSSVLVGAATLPAFRCRGAQSALISRRLSDASGTSSTVVVTAANESASHANLERLGFTVQHVRTLWQPDRGSG